MQIKFCFLLLCAVLFLQCADTAVNEQQLQGFWQSLNESDRVVSISKEGNYALYVKGKNLYENIEGFGQIQLKIVEKLDANNARFELIDSQKKKLFVRGKVEIVDSNRIRLYFFKHNGILDLADEYYRTNGFGNFAKIMATFDTTKW